MFRVCVDKITHNVIPYIYFYNLLKILSPFLAIDGLKIKKKNVHRKRYIRIPVKKSLYLDTWLDYYNFCQTFDPFIGVKTLWNIQH